MNFLGIDIGSKHSLIAYTVADTFPEIVPNCVSSPVTPSCVIYQPVTKSVYIGEDAVDKQLRYPKNTTTNFTMTPTFSQNLPYFYYTLMINNLLKDVKSYLDDKTMKMNPKDTVVTLTVPSEMPDTQKNLYKDVIQSHFGFQDVLTLNDIEAAALCLKTMHSVEKKNVLIVDIGAHHTTAAVFAVGETIECVNKASAVVGGNNFDEKIVEYVKKSILEKNHIDLMGQGYEKTLIRAQRAVEKSRILLSTIPESYIEVDGINDGSVKVKMSRELLQTLIADDLKVIENLVQKVVRNKDLKIEQVEVIGGTGRAPYVVNIIKHVVGQEVKFLNSIDSACSIALGGAIHGEKVYKKKEEDTTMKFLKTVEKMKDIEKKESDTNTLTKPEKVENKQDGEKKKEEQVTEKPMESENNAPSVLLKEVNDAEIQNEEILKQVKDPQHQKVEEKQQISSQLSPEVIKNISDEMDKATSIIAERERKMWILNDVETKINKYRNSIATKEGNMPQSEITQLSSTINKLEEWLDTAESMESEQLEKEYKENITLLDTSAPTLKTYLDAKEATQKLEKEKAEKMRAERVSTGETAKKRPEPKTNKEKYEAYEKAKEKGTKAFKDTDWLSAIRMYSAALGHLEAMFDMTPTDTENNKKGKLALYLNLAICFIKVSKFNKALDNADSALKIDENNIKGLFRKGLALNGLKKYEEALGVFKKLETIEKSASTESWIKNIEAKLKQQEEEAKRVARRMFGN
ncbi:chaperone protein DNAK, putative [Entamoeba invadens IP1]|uniref:Chaperone protein DNAK, putative n=1 Tax=Entamoeba invadens IP1 TaxID=370355 RepID=A0A0A1TU27_ENTIV|nr:chaperone protein DNAK, putative [Entamoeba invadens IP1]ELP83427.1 chaperone protein DNAK, putative [Entamoeba invadens IP1]|eukprot:XP_004182773.1 chaperone protein DNAK, putative [Entamoeba invadens IP1]